MKKSLLFVSAAVAVLMASCSNKGNDELNNADDSLSYAYGVGYGSHISEQYLEGANEGAKYDALMKGIEEAVNSGDSILKYYILGLQIGDELRQESENGLMNDSTLKLDKDKVYYALKKAIAKDSLKMTKEQSGQVIQEIIRKKLESASLSKYGEYKKQQEAFLTQNGKREGVVTTESGLQYEIIKAGNGAKPTLNDVAVVLYKGSLTDGTEFDSTDKHGGKPADMPLASLIPGWKEALQLMPAGSKWKIYIPSNLGYGSNDMGVIKPYSTLVFEVELLEVKAQQPQQ
ncbi:MAG: FKBP-type peptidyl-prolyl cis-trans isomerase [Paludibacteraceae bacterium]|nr:FKBP-type peptidyl-prolyl cis-trans isomerase [Paludibacteraceae bacterium]MBP5743093.1 FKBP-type peptidyl-prolyl cis-trans isomerase [Paludibacteraceae bacterium]